MTFPEPLPVKGRTSIADLLPPSRRCGIYLLRFTNGEMYVGQATDVTRRYIQHMRVHGDIETLAFRCVPKPRLDEHERSLIWTLEQRGEKLRNITFTSVPKGESDFDLVMPQSEQAKWVTSNSWDLTGPRVENPELRRKFGRHYERFTRLAHAKEIITVLRRYVRAAVPVPVRSELSFWACSCLPAGRTEPGERPFCRVNINWQVVLGVAEFDGELDASFHLARTPLQKAYGFEMAELRRKFSTLNETDNLLEPGGQDQMHLIIGIEEVERFLEDDAVVAAIRLFNLRLMQKGPCAYSRYHCLDLADELLRE